VALLVTGAAAGSQAPRLTLSVFANTGGHALNSILWTGHSFLYVENTTSIVWSAPAAGTPLTRFASMPTLVEETRCVLSPGTRGFPPGATFCQSPDNKIYELSADGSSVTVFATLPAPYPPASDGALAFDNVGRFGSRLLAATGRSGTPTAGGTVFAIDSSGRVTRIGGYEGPGGADELAVAPARFGRAGGDALLTVDAGAGSGALVAMDPAGHSHAIVRLPHGLNPIAVLPAAFSAPPAGSPPAGLYVTNDEGNDVYAAPAAQLAPFAGEVVVGAENSLRFWIVRPRSVGFAAVPLSVSPLSGRISLEGALFIG
jgi:hypothetical protein